MVNGRSPLLGKVRQDRPHRGRLALFDHVPVFVHGVAGEVESSRLLFHGHELVPGKLRDIFDLELGGALRLIPTAAEQIELARQVLALVLGDGVHKLLIGLQ